MLSKHVSLFPNVLQQDFSIFLNPKKMKGSLTPLSAPSLQKLTSLNHSKSQMGKKAEQTSLAADGLQPDFICLISQFYYVLIQLLLVSDLPYRLSDVNLLFLIKPSSYFWCLN